MDSSMDRIWLRLKAAAKAVAESGKSISYRRARSIVAGFLQEECVDMTRAEVLDYLTNEFLDHVAEYMVVVTK